MINYLKYKQQLQNHLLKPQKNKVNPLRNIILENGTKLVLDLSGLMEVIDKIEGDYDEKKKISVRKS